MLLTETIKTLIANMDTTSAYESITFYTAIILGLLSIFYIYLTWHFDYWRKKGVPTNRPWPLLGTLGNPFNPPEIELHDQEQYKKLGRVCGFYEGRYPGLYVGEPELLRTILVKDFHVFPNRRMLLRKDDSTMFSKFLSLMQDEEWKSLRNAITPTFTTGKMKFMVSLIQECAEQLQNHFKALAEKDYSFEGRECFSAFTMDVVATCAFGTKIDSMKNPNSDFVKHAKKIFGGATPKWLLITIMINQPLAFYLFEMVSKKPITYLAQVIDNIMEKRKTEHQPRKDFLQILMEAKTESEKEDDNDKTSSLDVKERLLAPKLVLTDEYIKAQAILFFVAGFETTSITLSFAAYSLAMDENIQNKLIKEIDEAFERHEGKFSYDVMMEMQYLDMVISETLRMYPPATRLERVCEVDGYKLGDIILNKGSYLYVPIYAMHHDEEFYPSPHIFDPERFSTENKNKRNPYTYLPFGQGPRNCVGFRFALMTMKIVLVYILKEFRFKVSPETDVPFKRSENTFFLQPQAMKLKLEPRTKK